VVLRAEAGTECHGGVCKPENVRLEHGRWCAHCSDIDT
jgi:hypothetical protein